MSTDEKNGLDKLVAVKSAKKAAELNDEIEKDQRAKLHEFAARGILRGGATINFLVALGIRRLDGHIRGRYDAFKEVYRAAGLLTPESLRERGQREATHFTEGT